jgi:hypothetical protein
MGIHKIEIILHEAGTTKNLDLMLSLFADDATLTSGGKAYKGKDEIRGIGRLLDHSNLRTNGSPIRQPFASSAR